MYPKEAVRLAYFEVAMDDNQQYHWALWSGNGRLMATNPNEKGYKKVNDCTTAIRAIKDMVQPGTRIVIAHE